MAKKRYGPEQVVMLLRQIEVATSQGKSIGVACREAGGLTDILYQRDGDYCIADVPSRWDIGGASVCGAGGRYRSDECGLTVL
jgi:hypothetical protein